MYLHDKVVDWDEKHQHKQIKILNENDRTLIKNFIMLVADLICSRR